MLLVVIEAEEVVTVVWHKVIDKNRGHGEEGLESRALSRHVTLSYKQWRTLLKGL